MTAFQDVIAQTIDHGVPWFPQEHAHLFYLIKGSLALVALLMVVFHMNQTWSRVIARGSNGQVIRYMTLLGYTALVSFSTVEQLKYETPVAYRNLGTFVVVILTIAAMAVSIREDYRSGKHGST